MAEVAQSQPPAAGTSASAKPWTAAQTRAQFLAITRLRWQIFRNNLRRKNGVGDIIATVILLPVFLGLTVGPSIGAGLFAYFSIGARRFGAIAIVLWAIFALSQFTNLQLGQAATTFDPTQLIRFPLNFRGYALIRTFFGLISPANIVVTMAAFSVALGVSVADFSLAPTAFAAMTAFALANIFFTRMIFSWVDRWLSTRRAREVFTGLIFAFSLGIQWLNFTFNPGLNHSLNHGHHGTTQVVAQMTAAQHLYAQAQPVLALLPPGLAVRSLVDANAGRTLSSLLAIAGVLLFAAVFFAIFALRLRKEFRGENLSQMANAVAKTPTVRSASTASAAFTASAAISPAAPSRFAPPPTVAGVLGKELLTMRRNTGVFYAVVAPLVFVVLIVSKLATHTPVWIVFPAAVAYTMLGISPLSYNSLGLEATGIQFYFLAPIRWRDVFLAKNLINLLLAAVEFIATFITVTIAAHAPSWTMTLAALFWAMFVLSISMAIGNHRSITSPKKLDPSKPASKQTAPLSNLIGVGVLLVLSVVGAAALVATRFFALNWLLVPIMLALALVGALIYNRSLNRLDDTVARNRDTLIEVLCKAG